jgi:hypothetical protein
MTIGSSTALSLCTVERMGRGGAQHERASADEQQRAVSER